MLAATVTVVVVVLLADLVRTSVRTSGLPAVTWNPLDPWLPTLTPARANYAVAPCPALLRAGTVLTAALVAAAVCLWCSRLRNRWATFVMVWVGLFATAVITVGAAQSGDILLGIQQFGGRGGSHIRTFTIPALWEAARWAALWGWLPALAFALVGGGATEGPVAGGRRIFWLGLLAFAIAALAGVLLAWIAHDAAISTQTVVA